MKTHDSCPYLLGTAETGNWPHCGSADEAKIREGDFLSRSSMKSNLVHLSDNATLLDRFLIKGHLGNGRFASVYLAEDLLRSTELALKVVEVGPCSEPIAAAQLKRELDAYSKITSYENIIRVYDLHYVPWGGTGLLALTMDYAEGGTLRKWLLEHANNLSARHTIGMEYFKQACRGAGSAHNADTLNLDLKPENLLFSNSVIKVSDFGAARFAQMLRQTSISRLDLPSFDVGTPTYMSPDHFTAPHPDDVDARADIYSLGIILYELQHPKCRPPFGGSDARLKELHITIPAPRLIEAGDNMECIIAKCLEKDPADRYQSVWELLDDLEHGYRNNSSQAFQNKPEQGEAAHIEEIWEKASHWFSNGDFNEAARLTEEVLGMDPEHAQAQRLKEEIETRFDEAKWFYQKIEKHLEGGNLDQLVDLLQEAISIYPEHPSGRPFQERLHSQTKQYRELWETVTQSVSQQKFDEAANYLKEILRIHPKDTKAKELMKELVGRSAQARHFYQVIENGLERGEDLNDLVRMALEANSFYPDFPEGRLVQIKLAGKSKQFRKAMEKGAEALKQGAWEVALKWFCQVQKLCPNSIELGHIIERLSQISNVRLKITDALLRKRFNDAKHFAKIVDLEAQNLKNILPILRD
jgi:serine/threonine protein kinase